jgi:hypothetical protein
VQEIATGVIRHIRELGGLQVDYLRPKAFGLDGPVPALLEAVKGGKWLWVHGLGMSRWPGTQ